MKNPSPDWKILEWDAPILTLSVDGETHQLVLTGSPRRPRWSWKGSFQSGLQPGASAGGQPVSDESTVSPMPGTVLEVRVKPGDEVEEGQTLVVVEAMKMQNALSVSRDGKVKAIHVASGEKVADGDLLIELGEDCGEVE